MHASVAPPDMLVAPIVAGAIHDLINIKTRAAGQETQVKTDEMRADIETLAAENAIQELELNRSDIKSDDLTARLHVYRGQVLQLEQACKALELRVTEEVCLREEAQVAVGPC